MRPLRNGSSYVCTSDLFFEQGSQGSEPYACFEFVGYADLRKLKAGLDLLGGERAAVLLPATVEIGRASCRERVDIKVDAVAVKKKNATAMRSKEHHGSV